MVKDVLQAKNRLMASAGLFATAFVFFIAAILTGAIALFGVALGTAAGFLVAGALAALAAKWIFPKPQLGDALSGLEGAQFAQLAEQFLQGFQAGMAADEVPRPDRPGAEAAPTASALPN